jgi:hypothetical protein
MRWGSIPTSRAPSSSSITERTARPRAAPPHGDPQDVDRPPSDAQGEPLRRITPGEVSVDDEGHAEGEEQAEQDPRLTLEAIYGAEDGLVEYQPERHADRQPDADRGQGGDPGFDGEEGGHCRDDRHLPVGEVEHTAEPVHQGEPGGEKTELKPEDDPVEDAGDQVTPR